MRWALLLQEYSFDIVHTPGRDNELADYLSRNPDPNQKAELPSEDRLLLPETNHPTTEHINLLNSGELYQQVSRAQRRSRRIQQDIKRWRDVQQYGSPDANSQKFLHQYLVEDGLLWRRHGSGNKLVVPSRYLTRVVAQAHDTPESAHPGRDETFREVSRRYHHRNLHRRVTEYVQDCLICASIKSNIKQKKAPLKPRTPNGPFEVLSIDILGPFHPSTGGHRYVIMVEDTFTKWTEAIATTEATFNQVGPFLEEQIFDRYGSPKMLISDNGSVFRSHRYLHLLETHHIQAYYTPIFHQRANPVERRVQEFKKVLKALMFNLARQRTWHKYVPQALRILRSRQNQATGVTPAKALLGYELPRAGDWEIAAYNREREADLNRREARRKQIHLNQRRFNERVYQNNPRPPRAFFVGDLVMAREMTKNHAEFRPTWSGPYQVEEVHSPEVYSIIKRGLTIRVHIDNLRPAPRGNLPLQDMEETGSEDDPHDDRETSTDEMSLQEDQGSEQEGPQEAGALSEVRGEPGVPMEQGRPTERLSVSLHLPPPGTSEMLSNKQESLLHTAAKCRATTKAEAPDEVGQARPAFHYPSPSSSKKSHSQQPDQRPLGLQYCTDVSPLSVIPVRQFYGPTNKKTLIQNRSIQPSIKNINSNADVAMLVTEGQCEQYPTTNNKSFRAVPCRIIHPTGPRDDGRSCREARSNSRKQTRVERDSPRPSFSVDSTQQIQQPRMLQVAATSTIPCLRERHRRARPSMIDPPVPADDER